MGCASSCQSLADIKDASLEQNMAPSAVEPKASPSASPVQLHAQIVRHMSGMSALSAIGISQLPQGELSFLPG